MNQEHEKPAGMWAVVEIFGHQRIAGFLTEQVIAGQGFIRVDVPEIPAQVGGDGPIAAHTKMFGPGAIYGINPVDEAIATAAARNIRHAPVHAYGMADVFRTMPQEERLRLMGPDDGNG